MITWQRAIFAFILLGLTNCVSPSAPTNATITPKSYPDSHSSQLIGSWQSVAVTKFGKVGRHIFSPDKKVYKQYSLSNDSISPEVFIGSYDVCDHYLDMAPIDCLNPLSDQWIKFDIRGDTLVYKAIGYLYDMTGNIQEGYMVTRQHYTYCPNQIRSHFSFLGNGRYSIIFETRENTTWNPVDTITGPYSFSGTVLSYCKDETGTCWESNYETDNYLFYLMDTTFSDTMIRITK